MSDSSVMLVMQPELNEEWWMSMVMRRRVGAVLVVVGFVLALLCAGPLGDALGQLTVALILAAVWLLVWGWLMATDRRQTRRPYDREREGA